MSVNKSPQNPIRGDPEVAAGRSVRRTASIETLPQYGLPSEDARRRSLEDAAAPLPEGWFCHLDTHSNHHYYVDMNSIPPRSVWLHPRHDVPPPPLESASTSVPASPPAPPRRMSLIARLKSKLVLTQEDREALARQQEAKEQELLARYAKRRAEVMAEIERDGLRFAQSEYVGPPASPYGGTYRGLAMAPGLQNNLGGWLA